MFSTKAIKVTKIKQRYSCHIQFGHNGLSPIWWLNVQMVYLSYLSNGTYVSFIADYIFLKKKRIVFTIGASTLSLICFLYNNTFVLKIVCVDFSIRVFRKRLKCYASRKSCINKMFLSPKRLILFKKRHDLSTVDTK